MPPLTDLATEFVHQTLPTALSYYASVMLSYVRKAQRVVMQIIPSFRIRCSRPKERACPAKTKTPSELSSPAGMENVQPGSDLSL